MTSEVLKTSQAVSDIKRDQQLSYDSAQDRVVRDGRIYVALRPEKTLSSEELREYAEAEVRRRIFHKEQAVHFNLLMIQAFGTVAWEMGLTGVAARASKIAPGLLIGWGCAMGYKVISELVKPVLSDFGQLGSSYIISRLGIGNFANRILENLDSQLEPSGDLQQKWIDQPPLSQVGRISSLCSPVCQMPQGGALLASIAGASFGLKSGGTKGALIGAGLGVACGYLVASQLKELSAKSDQNKAQNVDLMKAPCVFDVEIDAKVKELELSVKNNIDQQEGKRKLPCAIFYGPSGTGKTMVCQRMTRIPGVNYIDTSAAELMQTGSPLSQIRRIFHKASRSSAPTVLFIDECDKLFYDRDILKGMELSGYGRTGYAHALIDLFLSMTGGGSDKITVLLATNNISLFDPALLNRMDYQIKLEFPSLEARTKLIKTYVDLKMKKEDVAIFTDAKIHEIAVLIEGFSGRRIEMLVGRILRKQQLNLGVSLTESMINQVVHECLKEFKDLERAIKEGREGKGDAKSKSDDAAQ